MRLQLVGSLLLGLLVFLGRLDAAHADETDGTWSGNVELTGNYYYERSTRVMAPAMNARVVTPDGLQVNARYLVDAITSASLATGVVRDTTFTEIRHDVTVGVSGEVPIENVPVRFRAQTRVSYEPDYLARGLSLGATVALNKRATLLNIDLGVINDDVGRILRGVPVPGTFTFRNTQREDVGSIFGISTGLSVSHALTSELMLSAGYELSQLHGYLANVYRTVPIEGTPKNETHPDNRTRHAFSASAAYYITPLRGALHLTPNFYTDSYGIVGGGPEALYYQEVGEYVLLRARGRIYWQSAASFYKPPAEYTASERYFTADPKMTEFHTVLAGLQASIKLDFLEKSPLHIFHEGLLTLSFERYWNTNRFGPGVIAQSGILMPF